VSSVFILSLLTFSPVTNFASKQYTDYYQANKVLITADRLTLERNRNCLANETVSEIESICKFDNRNEGKRLFLWGDSHAASLANGFIAQNSYNIYQATMASCPPLLKTKFARNTHCLDFNDRALLSIQRLRPEVVIMLGNWSQTRYLKLGTKLSSTVFEVHSASPKTEVIVLGGLPQWGISLPEMLARHHVQISNNLYSFNSGLRVVREIDAILKSELKYSPSVFISIAELVCNSDSCLSVIKNSRNEFVTTAFDYSHLTTSGSAAYVDRIVRNQDFPR
jgi:hypothetical protein